MRSGDRIRALQLVPYVGLLPAALFALAAWTTGRFPVWWAVPVGLIGSVAAIWAGATFFGVTHLERLAAQAVHGGRHYYFEQHEIRVLFDEDDGLWLRLDDIRRAVGGDPRVLRHFGDDEATHFAGQRRRVFVSAAGARRYLKSSRHPDRARFLLWLERDLEAPIAKRRERGLTLHGTGGGRI
ncbi:MAG: hypothetical protein JNM90_18470 [Burkholderiales bacterium]|nr:hypothetical protein [Burkholderiales bacterium]